MMNDPPGAAQGIGKEAALQFAREGAKVIVSDLDESELRRGQS